MKLLLPSFTERKHTYLSILCLLIIWFVIQIAYTPGSYQVDDDTGFDALRAVQTLKQLLAERQPHPTDSPENRLVLKRIEALFQNYGYRTEIQEVMSCEDSLYGASRCAKVRNITAIKPGSTGEKGLLLAAHYDSVEAGPGVNDDGVGVAVLLEIARINVNYDNKRTIVFLLTEGEENGLLGAKAFIDKNPLAKTLSEVINIEARGSGGPSLMFETNNNNQSVVDMFVEHAQQPITSSVFYEIYKRLPNNTDFTVFKAAGLQGLNFAHIKNLQHYHTGRDSFDNLNIDTLAHHGRSIARLTKQLSGSEQVLAAASENVVYTDIAGLFVLQWQESSSVIMSIMLLLSCFCLMSINIKRKQLTFKQVLAIFGFDMVLIILVMILATGGILLFQTLAGDNSPWTSHHWPTLLLLVAVSIWISLPFFRKQQQMYEKNSYLLHSLLIYALLSLITSLYLAGISYLFIIPALVILLMLLISAMAKTDHPLLIVYLPFVVTMIPFVQLIQLLIIANGFTYGAIYVFLLMLALLLLKPILSQHRVIHRSILGYLCLLVIISTTAYTAIMPVYSDQHPKSQNLIHINFVETGESFVSSYSWSEQQPDFIVNNSDFRQVDGKIYPWHRSEYSYFRADVAMTDLPAIEVKVSAVDNHPKQYQLDLEVQQSIRGYTLYIPKSAELQQIQLSDQVLFYTEDKVRNYYRFKCFGESCGLQTLLLTLNSKQSETLYLVTRYSGLNPDFRDTNERDNTAYYYGDHTELVRSIQIN